MKNTFTFKVFNFYEATFNLFSQDLPGLCFSNLQIKTSIGGKDILSAEKLVEPYLSVYTFLFTSLY